MIETIKLKYLKPSNNSTITDTNFSLKIHYARGFL